jgi:hypothetical protein
MRYTLITILAALQVVFILRNPLYWWCWLVLGGCLGYLVGQGYYWAIIRANLAQQGLKLGVYKRKKVD